MLEQPDKDPEFQSLAVTNKHMVIGTKGKIKLSDRYVSIKSLTLNPKEDVIAITATCPYQIEELESVEGENQDQIIKFNPPDLKNKDKNKTPYSFLFTHKKNTNTKVEYKYKERIELLHVGIKSLTSSLTHASFKKIFKKGIHNGCVYDMSVCKNKSILVSLGEDSVKVFNHTNEWEAHSTFEFEEQPLCIDLHPSGDQIAVGFKTGTRLYQHLDNELKLSFEKFGKATITIAYSHGGHLLATNSSCYIDIIDPIRLQLLYTLWGHKGVVRSLYWTENSKFLVSTCNCGGIFFWRANFKDFGYNKGQDEIEPESSYYDESSFFYNCIYDERFDALITLTSHSVLKILRNKGSQVYFEDKMPGFTATCLAFCKELSTIVLGTAEGKLIFRNWPIVDSPDINKSFVLNVDTNPITELKFSLCRRFLFVSCDNGNIYCLLCSISDKISSFNTSNMFDPNKDLAEHQAIQKRREVNGFKGFNSTDNLALINNSTLYRVKEKIESLKEQIKNRAIKYKEELKKITKRFEKHKKMIEDELKASEKNRQEICNLEDKRIQDIEQQKSEIESLINAKEKLLSFINAENDDLESEILRLNDNLIHELNKVEFNHKTAIQELIGKYESSLGKMKDEITLTVKKLKENATYFENVLNEQEEEYNEYEQDIEVNQYTKSK